MAKNHLFAGVAVANYEPALAWYERLFGRPPDVIVKDSEAMWQLTDGGWVYVVADSDRAGNALLNVLVDNLDEQIAELGKRGIATGAIEVVPGMVRKAAITDPEGNRITLGEDLS